MSNPEERGPLEVYYDTELAPLVAQLRDCCKAKGIDFVLHFVLDEKPERYRCVGSAHIARDNLEDMVLAAAMLSGAAQVIEVEGIEGMPLPQLGQPDGPDEILQ